MKALSFLQMFVASFTIGFGITGDFVHAWVIAIGIIAFVPAITDLIEARFK